MSVNEEAYQIAVENQGWPDVDLRAFIEAYEAAKSIGQRVPGEVQCKLCGFCVTGHHPLCEAAKAKEQPDGLSVASIKMFTADPKVHDAVRNPADPFSMAWHKREEEHRRALEAAKSPERESGTLTEQARSDAVKVIDDVLICSSYEGPTAEDVLSALLARFDIRRRGSDE